jgi:hypothetical protein
MSDHTVVGAGLPLNEHAAVDPGTEQALVEAVGTPCGAASEI